MTKKNHDCPDDLTLLHKDARLVGALISIVALGLGLLALSASYCIPKESSMGTFITNPTDEVVFTHSAKDDSETRTIQVWLPDKTSHPLQGQVVCIALTGFSGTETTPPGGEAGLIVLSAVPAVAPSQTGNSSGTGGQPTTDTTDVMAEVRKPAPADSVPTPSPTIADKASSGVKGCAIETKLPVVDKGSPLALRLTWKANDAKMQLGTYLGQITAKHDGSEYVVLPVRVVVVATPTPPPPSPTPAPTDAATADKTPSPAN